MGFIMMRVCGCDVSTRLTRFPFSESMMISFYTLFSTTLLDLVHLPEVIHDTRAHENSGNQPFLLLLGIKNFNGFIPFHSKLLSSDTC